MATCFTRMNRMTVLKTVCTVGLLSLGLGGCLTPQPKLSDDFGNALHTAITRSRFTFNLIVPAACSSTSG